MLVNFASKCCLYTLQQGNKNFLVKKFYFSKIIAVQYANAFVKEREESENREATFLFSPLVTSQLKLTSSFLQLFS
jgi:hypothetical protein